MHISYLRLAGIWLVAALAFAGNPALAAEPKKAASKATPAPPKAVSIVKWVDEHGVTHYGDSVPAQYSGRDNSELNGQGRVIKNNKAASAQAGKAEEETKATIEQRRRDKALLAAYTSEQEFDLARDRNLQTDEAALDGLNQQMAGAKGQLAATQKSIDGFNKRKKPVPPYITQDLKDHQDEVARIEAQIADRQQSMEATRKRFAKDKQRFIDLKRDPNAPLLPETAPTTISTGDQAPTTSTATVPSPVSTNTPPAPASKPAMETPAAAGPAPKKKMVVMP